MVFVTSQNFGESWRTRVKVKLAGNMPQITSENCPSPVPPSAGGNRHCCPPAATSGLERGLPPLLPPLWTAVPLPLPVPAPNGSSTGSQPFFSCDSLPN